MTPEEFKEKMQAIADRGDTDPEINHVDADRLLCEVLESLGFGDGVAIFHGIMRWYA